MKKEKVKIAELLIFTFSFLKLQRLKYH